MNGVTVLICEPGTASNEGLGLKRWIEREFHTAVEHHTSIRDGIEAFERRQVSSNLGSVTQVVIENNSKVANVGDIVDEMDSITERALGVFRDVDTHGRGPVTAAQIAAYYADGSVPLPQMFLYASVQENIRIEDIEPGTVSHLLRFDGNRTTFESREFAGTAPA